MESVLIIACREWFDFKIPKNKISEDFIFNALQDLKRRTKNAQRQ
jgi:acyl carrier protein